MRHHFALALLVAVALLATATLGCGGGEDGDSTTQSTQATTTAEQGNSKQQQGSGTDQSSGEQDGGEDTNAATNLGPVVSNPNNKQLGIVSGGDNSLQTFGETAQQDERDQVILAMRSFFRALANGNTQAACDYLTGAYLQSLEALAKQLSKGSPTGCAALAAVVKQSPPGSVKFEAAKGAGATVLRVGIEGDTAILMLRPRSGKLSYYTMTEEDGQWKASTLAIVTLP